MMPLSIRSIPSVHDFDPTPLPDIADTLYTVGTDGSVERSTSCHVQNPDKATTQTFASGSVRRSNTNKNGCSPKSSESLTHAHARQVVDGQSLRMMSHEEARRLREELKALRRENSMKQAQCHALKHEADNLQLALD